MTRKKKHVGPWSAEAGHFPYKVVVEENVSRGGALTLRWWSPGHQNWRRKALGNVKLDKPIRTKDGQIDAQVAQWALEQAMEKSRELSGSLPSSREAQLARRTAIGETFDLISDPKTGLYPHDSEYRRELKRSLDFACSVWGKDAPWLSIDDAKWTELIRARVEALVRQGYVGVRSAEITIVRLSTAARWLRRTKKIPAGTAELPDEWKDGLKAFRRGLTKSTRDPEPHRPRHTIEEVLAILRAGIQVDPRGALLLALGAEQRLGQVRRAMRSDLTLPAIDWAVVNKLKDDKLAEVEFGELRVFGAGRKGGTTIALTKGQRVMVDIYVNGLVAGLELSFTEASIDYPVFPAGKLMGRLRGTPELSEKMDLEKSVSRQWVQKTFRAIEVKADVKHVRGRATYGLRRQSVDAAIEAGISMQGLQAQGGWSSSKIPLEIYKEKDNKAGRREARAVRSRVRKESQE